MAPKKGAKGKGKKGNDDDDAHWEKLAAKLVAPGAAPAEPTAAEQSEGEDEPARPKAKQSFAAMSYEEIDAAAAQDDDEDGEGGLMAMLKKSKAAGKGKKEKKKRVVEEFDYDEEMGVTATEPAVEDSKAPVEVDPDAWMNEEFGEAKSKKDKKGKGKKGGKKVEEDFDEDAMLEEARKGVEAMKMAEAAKKAELAASAALEKEEVEEEKGGVLSKSEKEKIKKEKEKAKKKAQAAAKKASGATAPADVPEPVESTPAAAEPIADNAEDEEEAGEADGKKKKKKKKAAVVEKKVEAPSKKGGAQMNALRLLVEAQKKAAEETAAFVAAERKRIDDEEARLEEEERLKAEEKAKKKEKEKAKRDQLKKEGKLLTPKQKADKLAAEIRLASFMSASGVTIEGLKTPPAGEEAPRKVSYAKKKPFVRGGAKVVEVKIEEPVVVELPEVVEVEKVEEDDVKEDWEMSDEEEVEVKKAESVKDDWDASDSEEEEEKVVVEKKVEKVVPAVVAKTIPAAVKSNGKTAPAKNAPKASSSKAPPPPKAAAAPTKPIPSRILKAAIKPTLQGKVAAPSRPVAVVESSSEDESSSEGSSSGSGSDDSDSDSDDSDDDSEDEETAEGNAMARQAAQKRAEAKERRLAKEKEALAARSKDNMRSPICVILGHVDTGKTKLLDKIRQTNVQEGEAGGITQQIGATYFPMDAIRSKTSVLGDADLKEYKLPGLLVIDTPGHESFTNLRTRGSSLCNIAILVVDIMHGLEPQTLESLRLLRDGKTPFIVALNKIDRLYGWKAIADGGFQASLAAQDISVQREYKDRLEKTILAFAEQGLNSLPYYDNKDFARVVSLVPTSAHTGEGVPDMLMLIIKLTQERMTERLMYLSTLECTVLEVKVIEGLGTTIDVVLSNGVLREGDRIVVCGLNGPISTQIRALLTPQPMKELRIKGQYVHHKEVKASLGIKIVAPDLEKAIAGSRLLVVTADDDEDELREDIMSDLTNLMDSVDKSGRGVCVQASTLGSLEALLEFLRTSKIPVSGINIGPVHKKDVMRAASMLEKAKELAVILCFDVPVDKEAEKLADELGIKIFKADIIYHLFDAFKAYNAAIVEAKRVDSAPKAVWPCKLKIIACFTKRDPIILGCDIIEGTLRVGTPLCVVKTDPETKKKEIVSLGRVTSLEINHKVKDVVKKSEVGAGVAVKIEHASYESAKHYGRHFDDTDEVIAMVSRVSIDTLKEHFRDEVTKDDWLLIKQLKVKLGVD